MLHHLVLRNGMELLELTRQDDRGSLTTYVYIDIDIILHLISYVALIFSFSSSSFSSSFFVHLIFPSHFLFCLFFPLWVFFPFVGSI